VIEDGTGNLLTADVDALVNTVNTAGVMGKGIALQFKRAFPDNYEVYRAACKRGEVRLGGMFVHDTGRLGPNATKLGPEVDLYARHHRRSQAQTSGID
jgi:O-acetyl-ADP-ribose deacetylase (regulator of RNase III)